VVQLFGHAARVTAGEGGALALEMFEGLPEELFGQAGVKGSVPHIDTAAMPNSTESERRSWPASNQVHILLPSRPSCRRPHRPSATLFGRTRIDMKRLTQLLVASALLGTSTPITTSSSAAPAQEKPDGASDAVSKPLGSHLDIRQLARTPKDSGRWNGTVSGNRK
jgi:hypothetical protein